jgi:hypothetical protein
MPILYGAVAYRQDAVLQYEPEINRWELHRTCEHRIACPNGCGTTYVLIVEVNASDQEAQEYVERIQKCMQAEQCPKHEPRIRIDDPGLLRQT